MLACLFVVLAWRGAGVRQPGLTLPLNTRPSLLLSSSGHGWLAFLADNHLPAFQERGRWTKENTTRQRGHPGPQHMDPPTHKEFWEWSMDPPTHKESWERSMSSGHMGIFNKNEVPLRSKVWGFMWSLIFVELTTHIEGSKILFFSSVHFSLFEITYWMFIFYLNYTSKYSTWQAWLFHPYLQSHAQRGIYTGEGVPAVFFMRSWKQNWVRRDDQNRDLEINPKGVSNWPEEWTYPVTELGMA